VSPNCRLHALLAQLREGGAPQQLSADRAREFLARVRPGGAADSEGKRLCGELLDEIRHLDQQLVELRRRTVSAVSASGPPSRTSTASDPPAPPSSSAIPAAWAASPSSAHSPVSMTAHPSTLPAGRSNPTASTDAGTANSTHALDIAAVTQVGHDTFARNC
jgi:pyruvate/2-oxoglutarate dehydrogenase complex dihydrolipoamide acyltransferase (E2) component